MPGFSFNPSRSPFDTDISSRSGDIRSRSGGNSFGGINAPLGGGVPAWVVAGGLLLVLLWRSKK